MHNILGLRCSYWRKRSVCRRITTTILLFTCVQSWAGEYAVHVGPNGYAPYAIVERNGSDVRYHGVIFDFLDAFESANPEFKRKHALLTRKRANIKMENGEDIDLMFNSPLFVSDAIRKHYKFTDPLFTTKDVVVTHKNNKISYQQPQDLYGKSIGTIRGYSYGKFDRLIKNGLITDMRVDHHIQAIGMLEKGRIDAYFGNIFVSPHYIKQLGLKVSDFTFSDVPMYEFEFAFAVKKDKPALFKKLNDFLAATKIDGSLEVLINNYIE
ncbi:MAG: transporter substrate-binding domain-containing protein [Granulosicoccus sp.]|nr:transporter substrate-binding domain-containing protein [Granulosicoccus sp.]